MSTKQDERPTFDSYWKKNKEHSETKSLVFVVQNDPRRSSIKGVLRIENPSAFYDPFPKRQF